MRVVNSDTLINHIKAIYPGNTDGTKIIDLINSHSVSLPKEMREKYARTPDYAMGFNACLGKIDRDLDENTDEEFKKLVKILSKRDTDKNLLDSVIREIGSH